MSPARAWQVMRKDLKLGPRSPMFLYAIVFPIIATFLVQVVFGRLFDPKPRVGIVDQGDSHIAAGFGSMEGIELDLLDSVDQLKTRVEGNDLDAGIVLQADFDQAVRSGERPLLEFYLGGESLAADRVVLAMTTVDLVREVQGATAPVEVAVDTVGGEALPLTTRMMPVLVLMALLIAGVFVPAASLVEEKEQRTLEAVLVTPIRLSEVLVGKAGLGLVLAVLMAVFTLVLNGALGAQPLALLVALVVAALMSVMFGLLYGEFAQDASTLFTLIKSANIFLVAPVFFYIWPNLPQWVAKIFPTYYVLDPIFEIAVKDASLGEVWVELAIALGICIALIAPVVALGRRMQNKLAAE